MGRGVFGPPPPRQPTPHSLSPGERVGVRGKKTISCDTLQLVAGRFILSEIENLYLISTTKICK
jgi:hypothetical protein